MNSHMAKGRRGMGRRERVWVVEGKRVVRVVMREMRVVRGGSTFSSSGLVAGDSDSFVKKWSIWCDCGVDMSWVSLVLAT